jgi:hypothetical protein
LIDAGFILRTEVGEVVFLDLLFFFFFFSPLTVTTCVISVGRGGGGGAKNVHFSVR